LKEKAVDSINHVLMARLNIGGEKNRRTELREPCGRAFSKKHLSHFFVVYQGITPAPAWLLSQKNSKK